MKWPCYISPFHRYQRSSPLQPLNAFLNLVKISFEVSQALDFLLSIVTTIEFVNTLLTFLISSSVNPHSVLTYFSAPPHFLSTISNIANILSGLAPTILSARSLPPPPDRAKTGLFMSRLTTLSRMGRKPISESWYSSAMSSDFTPRRERITPTKTPERLLPVVQWI